VIASPAAKTVQPLRVLIVLCTLMGFASISTDFYLPAMPIIATALQGGPGAMELTISGYLVGFSLGQLFWGPVGDRYGRRGPIGFGIGLFLIGSIGCALARSAMDIVVWRVVQALGACAGVVLSRAMVRDLYGGDRASQMLSTLIMVMAVAPLLGPILGAQVLIHAGWRAIFWLLVFIGVATGVGLATIPETYRPGPEGAASLGASFLAYGPLLRNRRVLFSAATGGFYYVGVYAYIAASPFAFITYHHVPASLYGLLFAAGIVGIMAMNLVNVHLGPRFGGLRIMRAGALIAAAGGLVFCLFARTGFGGLWGLVAPGFVFISASGLIVANSIGRALQSAPAAQAGSVSALIGAAQYGGGIAGSAMVGALSDGTPGPLGWGLALAGLGAAFFAWAPQRPLETG
jgi:DHA1 family bicyclomycin/chloramphenicol resistance-like MFS transporter